MGTILGKGFAQAQVHTNHSTSAEGTSAVMYARVELKISKNLHTILNFQKLEPLPKRSMDHKNSFSQKETNCRPF